MPQVFFRKKIDRHRFIEIPLMLRFQNGYKDIGLFTEIGFAQAFYVNTKSTINGSTVDIGNIGATFLKRNPFIGIASLGLNLNTLQKYQVFAQASFRYFITDLGASVYREHLFNYGMEMGIRRILNKRP